MTERLFYDYKHFDTRKQHFELNNLITLTNILDWETCTPNFSHVPHHLPHHYKLVFNARKMVKIYQNMAKIYPNMLIFAQNMVTLAL